MSASSQSRRSALWDDIHLPPVSLPTFGIADVELSTEFLGRSLRTPLLISGMTGGHAQALDINRNLAAAAESLGLAMGTGSQRAALIDPSLSPTYTIVRDHAPTAYLLGNIGMNQLVAQGREIPFDERDINTAVEMIRADALAVHLNVIEELIQPEGDREMSGLADAIAKSVQWSPVPVVAKETGAGMTAETAGDLAATGVAALDVGGVGGTSFALIEALRAKAINDDRGQRLGETFGDWGVPTAVAILESRGVGLPLIATGGVRNGLHAAKALALGAALVGIGGPVIRAAAKGPGEVIVELQHLIEELKVAMVLTGNRTVSDLRRLIPVVTGSAAEWARARGLATAGGLT